MVWWKGLRECSATKEMLHLAVNFYKILFGPEPRLDISLREDFWGENEKVSPEKNSMLEAPFTEEEIKEALFGSYAEGSFWT
jgi:hypothetical protein